MHEMKEFKIREKEYQSRIASTDQENQNHIWWAERRQADLEELRDTAGNRHAEIQELTEELETLKKDYAKSRTDKLALQADVGRLDKELANVRLELLNHPDPAVREKARLNAEIRTLTAENANLKKKIENMTKDWEYTKQLYSEASQAATDRAAELAAVEAKLPELERKAGENQAKMRGTIHDSEIAQLRKEVGNLKATVKSREKLVMRKEEQITELKRGRGGLQTRGSSVQPRSPRGGSRGASPAAAMLGGGSKGPSGLSGRFNLDG